MIDVQFDPVNGLEASYNTSLDEFRFAIPDGETWSHVILATTTGWFSDFGSDRKIGFGPPGVSHSFYSRGTSPNSFGYGRNSGSGWVAETVFTAPEGARNDMTLAVDGTGTPHVAFLPNRRYSGTLYLDVTYSRRGAGSWPVEIVVSSIPANYPHLSLAVDSTGGPVLALGYHYGNQPVQIFKKSSGSWSLLKTFPGPWRVPTIRFDGLDRLHLVMIATSPAVAARYVRMDGSGAVQEDVTYPLSVLPIFQQRSALTLDSDNNAHIVVSSAHITTSNGIVTYIPSQFNSTKITLVNGSLPYFLGQTAANSTVHLATRLEPPGTPQLLGRTPQTISWSWTSSSTESLRGYSLLALPNRSDLSGFLSAQSSVTLTSLTPNTCMDVLVRATHWGLGVDSPGSSGGCTLAMAPGSLGITRPSGNSVSLGWTPNGNPAGTLYRLRLIPPGGTGATQETTNQTTLFPLVDPGLPYAVTAAGVADDGTETFVSSLTHIASTAEGTDMSFALADDVAVDVRIQGPAASPALAIAVAPVAAFPTAPASNGDYGPTGMGFDIPTNQAVPPGQSVLLTLHDLNGVLNTSNSLTLARYDADRNLWVPLATQVNSAAHTLTAPTRALGLFQVLTRTSFPITLGAVTAYPNPFRPSQHGALALRDVPSGTQLKIHSSGGRLIRTLALDGGTPTWDGRDGSGELVHSGVYVLILEQGGNTQRIRVVVER